MIALIDADIVLYRCCWASQNDPLDICLARVDDMIDHILEETKADEFQLWLSDNKEENFRYKLDPTYKANRTQEKPNHFNEVKEYLVVKWGARIAYGMEADDMLGIEQTKYNSFLENPEYGGDGSCIATIDKDLKQVPGNHYNFVKKEFSFVTPEDGLRQFYIQLLVGDVSDNVKGCKGIGPVKAAKALLECVSEKEMLEKVVEVYTYKHNEWDEKQVLDHVLLAGQLLRIKQSEEEPLWTFPE